MKAAARERPNKANNLDSDQQDAHFHERSLLSRD
jgi:hypothetical protein